MITTSRRIEQPHRNRWPARLLVVGLLVTLIAPAANSAEFFAIVENTGRKPYGSLDVAVDTRTGVGVNVDFRVYDVQGTLLSEFSVPTNTQGFASTASFANLFDLSAGQPMLVRARTAQQAVNSGATLNVRSANGPLTVGIPPVQKLDAALLSAGRLFSIALGSFRSARLLIANISGSDQYVDVFRGTEGIGGSGVYYNPRLSNYGQWRVDLTQSDSLSNIVILASGVVTVQLVIDDGRTFHSSMVLPNF